MFQDYINAKPVACVGAVRLFPLFSNELGQQLSKRKRLMLGKLDRVIELIANLEADGAPISTQTSISPPASS